MPVKDIVRSKQRLRNVLFADERELLVLAMLRDVLGALRSTTVLEDVLVVTRDATVGRLARDCGAEVLAEGGTGGLNAALQQAAAYLTRLEASGMLIVPVDVPAIKPAEIALLAQEHGAGPAVTLVPDRRGVGTNAMAASPPDLCPFLFGEESLARHVAAARAVGVEPLVLDLAGFGHDVDTEHDLDELGVSMPGAATTEVLHRLGRAFPPPTAAALPREAP